MPPTVSTTAASVYRTHIPPHSLPHTVRSVNNRPTVATEPTHICMLFQTNNSYIHVVPQPEHEHTRTHTHTHTDTHIPVSPLHCRERPESTKHANYNVQQCVSSTGQQETTCKCTKLLIQGTVIVRDWTEEGQQKNGTHVRTYMYVQAQAGLLSYCDPSTPV